MTGMTKRFGLLGAASWSARSRGVYVSAQNSSGGRTEAPWRAGGPAVGPMGMLGTAAPMIMERLNLTDAQRDQVKSVIDAHRTISGPSAIARAAHRALEAVISADTVDEPAIRARSADVATIEADMALMRAQFAPRSGRF